MVKHRLVVNEGYASTLEETGGGWALTSYYTLQADDPLDPFQGITAVIQATVRNMQVDAEGTCFARVPVDIRDIATYDVIATGTLDVTNQSEYLPLWTVSSSYIKPSFEATINNVSTGEGVATIASAAVIDIEVETNKPLRILGEVTSRKLPSETAKSIFNAVVGAVQTLTLGESTEQTYTRLGVAPPKSYSYQRSSDGTEVMYSSSNAESGDQFIITDSSHQFGQLVGTKAGARGFNLQSGDEQWTGSSPGPLIAAEAQPPTVLTLLTGQNGENAGIVFTKIAPIAVTNPTLTVSQSTVPPDLAAATAADFPRLLTFQKLTKKN